MKITSIRRFLLYSLLGTVLISGLVTASYNYIKSSEQVGELFDAELAQMARMLQSITISEMKQLHLDDLKDALILEDYRMDEQLEDHEDEYSDLGHRYEKKLAFKIWNVEGKLLIESESAKHLDFKSSSAGFGLEKYDDHLWRLFSLKESRRGLTIMVAQKNDVREELINEMALPGLIVPLLLVPVVAWIIWLVVSKGLQPIEQVSKEVRRRDYDHLEPLDDMDAPQEVAPLIHALNDLLERVSEAADRERRFTSDAAHELRTPLATSKIQLQNARKVSTSDQTKRFINKSLLGLDRLHHLVEQLLILSRLDFESMEQKKQPVDMEKLCKEVIEELDHKADEVGAKIELDVRASFAVQGSPHTLAILLRNLMFNALHYGIREEDALPKVQIILDEHRVIVRDFGEGVPQVQLVRLTERFYRASDQTKSGSGLGLAISLQIAQLHGAEIHFQNREVSGFDAVITFIS